MSFSYDAGNLSLGPGKFWFDTGSGAVPIGLTQDAQIIGYEPSYQEIMANETGEALIDKFLKGEKMTVSLSMLERTAANFKALFPMLTEFTGTGTSYGIGATPGASLLDKAFAVRFHPINQAGAGGVDDETVLTDDWNFWKCANATSVTLDFTKDGMRVYKVVLDVFVDNTKPAGMRLALKGDPANTTMDVTPPTISSFKVEKSNVLTAVLAGTELTGVDVDTNIELVFSEELESGSALNFKNYSVITVSTDVPVDFSAAVISYTAATKTVLINPAASLAGTTQYTIAVNGVKDTAGNIMLPIARRIQTT